MVQSACIPSESYPHAGQMMWRMTGQECTRHTSTLVSPAPHLPSHLPVPDPTVRHATARKLSLRENQGDGG